MYDQVTSNKRRSAVLIAVFVLFVALVCAAFTFLLQWGPVGIVIAFLVAGGSAFVSYWKSDSVALAMSRARPATIEQYPRLHNLVEGLCIASGLPKPGVYIVDDPAPRVYQTALSDFYPTYRVVCQAAPVGQFTLMLQGKPSPNPSTPAGS